MRGYSCLLDLLPGNDGDAILEPIGSGLQSSNDSDGMKRDRKPLSHSELKRFIANDFDLRKYGIPWGTRLGVLIPVFLLLSIIITLIKSNQIINIVIEWSGISCLYNRCC